MCSLSGDVMIEEQTPSQKLASQSCKKCQATETAIVLRKIDVYCKACFLAASTHKFRAMLGKYRVIKPNDKVLVVFRIGHPSTSLVHMIRIGLDQSQHKKLRFEPVYLFIDEFQSMPREDRIELYSRINEQVSSFNFQIYFTTLQKFIENPSSEFFNYNEYITNISDSPSLKQKDMSQHQEISDIYRRNLTLSVAKKLDCKVVLTPDISIDTAVGILSDIALGRGSQVPLNVGVLDDRDSDVQIFTPLRLFEMKELGYYNHFYNLEPINIKTTNKEVVFASVQNLMKKFVEDLQVNYPSTIKTVTRTGDKLSCKKTDNICRLCKAPVENQGELSSIEATEFSQWVSTRQKEDIENFISAKNNDKSYCFACNKIAKLVR